jgi:hypothetical protein
MERCCSLGMLPITFNTDDEQKCFANLSANANGMWYKQEKWAIACNINNLNKTWDKICKKNTAIC